MTQRSKTKNTKRQARDLKSEATDAVCAEMYRGAIARMFDKPPKDKMVKRPVVKK